MKSFAQWLAALSLLVAASIVLVPPPYRVSAQFQDQGTWGGTSTGSANAQAITIGNYYAHKAGVVLRFIPGFTNNGPTQINVSGLGLVNVVRPSSIGPVAFSGSEFMAGEATCIFYTGSVYQLGCNVDMTAIGHPVEFRGTNAPRGTLIEDGSCVSATTYAALVAVIGTQYGSCPTGFFAVPDSRGSFFAALDNQGVNGSAGRITAGGSGCTATSIGRCGGQSQTLIASQLPSVIPYTDPGHNHGITDPGHAHAIANIDSIAGLSTTHSGALGFGGGSFANELAVNGMSINNAFTNVSINNGLTNITINPSGGNAHPILNPVLLGIRAIKY